MKITKRFLSYVRKTTGDLSELRESASIQNEYWNAIRAMDFMKLDWFLSMGESTRHQVMNVQEFRAGMRFGFLEANFSKHGWIKRAKWLNKETIELRTNDDNNYCNEISIGSGPNGKWTYGLSYNYGNSGGGWGLSVFNDTYDSRSLCLESALNEMKEMFTEKIKYASANPDPSNYKLPYMNKVLTAIAEKKYSEAQYSLFA